MNAKHLFLTLTMLLASITFAWGGTVTDNITSSGLSGGWSKSGRYSVSDFAATSSARYGGDVRWNKTYNYLLLQYNESRIASTTSGGILTQVSVTWYGTQTDKSVFVYGSNTAYTGSETLKTLPSDGVSELLATITYPSTTSADLSAEEYRYVAVVSDNTLGVTGINVTWTEEKSYNVKMDAGYDADYGVVTINGVTASAGATVTTAKAGDLVTIEVTPEIFFCLKSFTFGDMEFDLSCVGYLEETETGTYKIIMPEIAGDDITFTPVFDDMPEKTPQQITVKDGSTTLAPATPTSIQSGVSKTFNYELKYNRSSSPAYNGLVTITSQNSSVFAVTEYTQPDDEGKGTFTIKGFTGTAKVEIQTQRSINYYAGDALYNISVDPRQVALVAESSGSYYAMLHSYDAGKLDAQQIFKGGDTYYYDVAGSSVSDMTWNVMTTSVDDDKFFIMNPEDDKYLRLPAAKLLLGDATFEWYKDGDNMFTSSTSVYGLNFDTDHFTSATSWDNGVVETVIGDKFRPMTYSTVSGAGIVDSRKLAAGDYGTLCVPFDVASTAGSGATFYTITGKHVSGDNLVGIFISDPVTTLEAGHSYIYQIEGGMTSITLQGSSAFVNNADTDPDDGFVGCLPGDGESMTVPGVASRVDGNYGFSKGTLHYVQPEATPTIKKYRAYVKASELEKGDPAPGRRMLMNSDYTGEVTGIDDVVEVVFIDWSKPVYNIMGVQVGEGATGVLIQDGHKFLVQ